MKRHIPGIIKLSLLLILLCTAPACQTTSGNINADLNNYEVRLYLTDYTPKFDLIKYEAYKGNKMCMSNIRNDAGNTTNFNYSSRDLRVQYQFSNRPSTHVQFLQSYFWYAYQKAFQYAGIETLDRCVPEDLPELWIIFQSLNEDELQLKLTVLKKGVSVYEQDLAVTMVPATTRDPISLRLRAYTMIDLTITTMLDDPGLQTALLAKTENKPASKPEAKTEFKPEAKSADKPENGKK
jgi:hypothetical protein